MKKKKLTGLNLNKKTISRLNSSRITGGGHTDATCVGEGGNCTFGTNCCPGGGGTGGCGGGTVGPGCTRDTRELSYCQGITIPDGCLSVNPCA